VSLVQLLAHVEQLLGRPVAKTFHDWRPGDQRYYVSDTRRVMRDLGLPAPLPWRSGVARLLAWLQDESLPRLVEPERARLAASLHA